MYFSEDKIKETAQKHFQGWDYDEVFDFLGIDTTHLWDQFVKETASVGVTNALDAVMSEPGSSPVSSYQEFQEAYWDLLWQRISPAVCHVWPSDNLPQLSHEDEQTLLACRAYTYAAAHNMADNPLQPVWEGMTKVDCDCQFLRFFYSVVGFMWD